jgi:hypothetical protein
MTYRAGTIGFGCDREPRITCDEPGCRSAFSIQSPPPAWFLAGRAPPRWSVKQPLGGDRVDLCHACSRGAR